MLLPRTHARCKAFDASTEVEVLGIRFDTVSLTWQLPHTKLVSFVNLMLELIKPEDISPQRSKTKVYSTLRENVSHRPHLKQVFLIIHLELLFQLKTFFKESSAIKTQRPLIYAITNLNRPWLHVHTGHK